MVSWVQPPEQPCSAPADWRSGDDLSPFGCSLRHDVQPYGDSIGHRRDEHVVQDVIDSVEREIVIAAPIERVWELITVPEHVQAWYAFDGAKLALRPRGLIEHFWKEHGRYRGVVEEVKPPTLLSYWYSNVPDADPEPGRQTHVAIRLESTSQGDATVVRVTESGLASLEISPEERRAYLAATTDGWEGGLTALKEHAAGVTA
jgi:uncharacterized protein YndB with AHSA1/START domain